MTRLKLIALDDEDLAVVSAHCQDAVLKSAELEYIPAEKRFVIPMNRFVWENAERKSGEFERRKSVLHFERVEQVRQQGIERDGEQVLSLLAITFEEGESPAGTIEIAFAGGATLRLEVECIECQLTDLAAAWQTGSRPAHEI